MDFRGGAGSTIGVAYALRAKPDGYTILAGNSSMMVFPYFYPELNPGVINQLIPVTQLSDRTSAVIISTAALPNVHSLQDLIAYGKANPEKLNCNTAGAGSNSHIACVALSSVIGIPITTVHYKGLGPASIDQIAGRTHLSVGTVFQGMSHPRTLRFIAIMGAHRSKLLPELPTTHELGYDVDYRSWLGIFAPPNTPQPIVNYLNAEFVKAVKSPDVVAALENGGSHAVGSSDAEFRKRIAAELAISKKVIEDNKITAKD